MTRAEALRILELDDRCTPDQVRAAYRELVKVWHPDRYVNDAGLRAKADRRLQEINRAYALLQDRAETVETPLETTRDPGAATPHSAAQSTPARWSLARLVPIGLLTGVGVTGIVFLLVWLYPTAEPPGGTDATATVSVGDGAPQKTRSFRPVSGTDLLGGPSAGRGSLIVLNADRRDAVLVFVVAGVQERAVYIRTGEKLQMLDVAPGTHRIWVAAGLGWDRDHFAADQTFHEIEGPLTFVDGDHAPQTIRIAAPGTSTRPRLRARPQFLLSLRR